MDFAAESSDVLLADDGKWAIYRLDGADAKQTMDVSDHVPKGSTAKLSTLGADIALIVDDEQKTGQSTALLRIVGEKIVPAKTTEGKAFTAGAVLIRNADGNAFIGTIDTDRMQQHWRYAAGVVKPVEMPDGSPADMTSLFGATTVGDRLYFTRWSEEAETALGWSVAEGKAEPVKLKDGKQIAGDSIAWRSTGETVIAALSETEDTDEDSLWILDKAVLKPLTDKEGKLIRCSLWSDRVAGELRVLRVTYGEELEFRFLVMNAGREVGRLQLPSGKRLEGKGLSFADVEDGVYIEQSHGKSLAIWWFPDRS
jgi:hypothetical protein